MYVKRMPVRFLKRMALFSYPFITGRRDFFMSENLNGIQIQLLLYFLEAERKSSLCFLLKAPVFILIPFLKSRAATVNAVMMKRCTP